MIENADKDRYAVKCSCGAVDFSLLTNGQLECSYCGEIHASIFWGWDYEAINHLRLINNKKTG